MNIGKDGITRCNFTCNLSRNSGKKATIASFNQHVTRCNLAYNLQWFKSIDVIFQKVEHSTVVHKLQGKLHRVKQAQNKMPNW